MRPKRRAVFQLTIPETCRTENGPVIAEDFKFHGGGIRGVIRLSLSFRNYRSARKACKKVGGPVEAGIDEEARSEIRPTALSD